MSEAGVVGLELGFDDFVAIEIDERDFAMQEVIGETGFVQEQFRIAMVTGSFGNGYRGGSQPQKSVDRGADQLRVGIHRPPRNELDEVGFEQDRFPAEVQTEKANTFINQPIELIRILVCTKNCDT